MLVEVTVSAVRPVKDTAVEVMRVDWIEIDDVLVGEVVVVVVR